MNNELKKITKFINIAVLDVRNAGERSLGEVEMINVGYILHTMETLNLLRGGKRVNVGSLIEASPETTVLMDPSTFSNDFFNSQDTPQEVMVFGPLTIDPDTTADAIERGLARLDVFGGPFICPRHLFGTLQPKIRHLDVKVILYETPAIRVVMGKLVLDVGYLGTLEDDSELIVVGALRVPRIIPNNLLERKVKKLHVVNGIMCHEENRSAIQTCLGDASVKMKIIPAEYELVEKPLELNNSSLESLVARKMYCFDRVQISSDVEASSLDTNLDALISEDRVYCPAKLKKVISQKCDWLNTRVELYNGALWIVDDERELPEYAFDNQEGKVTLVVCGELRVDPQIDPTVLEDKLDKVHNLGSIWCTPEQMEVILTRSGINEGRLIDATLSEKQEKSLEPVEEVDLIQEVYVNSNYVAL
jgi:hypothetical protein